MPLDAGVALRAAPRQETAAVWIIHHMCTVLRKDALHAKIVMSLSLQ